MQKESEKDTHHKVGVYLDGYARLIANAEFYATLKPSMDEGERMDAQMAYMQYAGQRTQLGTMYEDGQLTPPECRRLAELDRTLLQNASAVAIAYGLSLGKLMRWLSRIGTPLGEEPENVRIEASVAELAVLAGVEFRPQPG